MQPSFHVRENTLSDGSRTYDVVFGTEGDYTEIFAAPTEQQAHKCRNDLHSALHRAVKYADGDTFYEPKY